MVLRTPTGPLHSRRIPPGMSIRTSWLPVVLYYRLRVSDLLVTDPTVFRLRLDHI
jgi:hypothetical protein